MLSNRIKLKGVVTIFTDTKEGEVRVRKFIRMLKKQGCKYNQYNHIGYTNINYSKKEE
jgi:DNA/RNA endonuclease YhcR with UshA esterase domain